MIIFMIAAMEYGQYTFDSFWLQREEAERRLAIVDKLLPQYFQIVEIKVGEVLTRGE